MFVSRFSWAVLALLLVTSAWAEEEDVAVNEDDDDTLLEGVNMDLIRDFDEPELIEGDIAVESEAEKNADPCTAGRCLWEKSTDGMVYVPYSIHNDSYSPREKAIIERGLESFSAVSCIRFTPYRDSDKHWISIESKKGCYSFVGRRGPGQKLSLGRRGCLYLKAIQHELLHSLGYHHEQARSDRDDHIQIIWENVIENKKANFGKKNTNNLDTSYDYNSVMQYVKTAFSKNKQPTMIPIPDSDVVLGKAKQMSQNDIDRLNKLYKCCE